MNLVKYWRTLTKHLVRAEPWTWNPLTDRAQKHHFGSGGRHRQLQNTPPSWMSRVIREKSSSWQATFLLGCLLPPPASQMWARWALWPDFSSLRENNNAGPLQALSFTDQNWWTQLNTHPNEENRIHKQQLTSLSIYNVFYNQLFF